MWTYNPLLNYYSALSNLWSTTAGLFWASCIKNYRSVQPPEHGPSSRISLVSRFYSKTLLLCSHPHLRPAYNWPSTLSLFSSPAKTWPINRATVRPGDLSRPTNRATTRPGDEARPTYHEKPRPAFNWP